VYYTAINPFILDIYIAEKNHDSKWIIN